jgi:hypothetical protein
MVLALLNTGSLGRLYRFGLSLGRRRHQRDLGSRTACRGHPQRCASRASGGERQGIAISNPILTANDCPWSLLNE